MSNNPPTNEPQSEKESENAVPFPGGSSLGIENNVLHPLRRAAAYDYVELCVVGRLSDGSVLVVTHPEQDDTSLFGMLYAATQFAAAGFPEIEVAMADEEEPTEAE